MRCKHAKNMLDHAESLYCEDCVNKEIKRVIGESADLAEEALVFFEHIKAHKEVKEAKIGAGIPYCKICGRSSVDILAEHRRDAG